MVLTCSTVVWVYLSSTHHHHCVACCDAYSCHASVNRFSDSNLVFATPWAIYSNPLWSCSQFLQCSLVFSQQPATYPTDNSWVTFVSSLLSGRTGACALAFSTTNPTVNCQAFSHECRRFLTTLQKRKKLSISISPETSPDTSVPLPPSWQGDSDEPSISNLQTRRSDPAERCVTLGRSRFMP